MLVNAAEMLKKAEAGHYALGAFNTNNLEWTLAILQAAEEAQSPLIMQCTGGAPSGWAATRFAPIWSRPLSRP